MTASNKTVVNMDLEHYVDEMRNKKMCIEKKNDYAVLCPECYQRHINDGDKYYRNLKLWINKSYQYGQCWVCHTVFLSTDTNLQTEIRKIESPVDQSNWQLVKLGNDGYWSLDRFNTFSDYDEKGIEYLCGRLYQYQTLYKDLGIKFKEHNPVTPFYYKGDLIFYQMRLIDPNSKIKYFTPSIEHKPPYIIDRNCHSIVICEGTFDAIACSILFKDRTCFAVLGSDITPYQIAILREMCPTDILIYMDKTEISERIKTTILQFINYAEITINKSDGEDPEEYLRRCLIKF